MHSKIYFRVKSDNKRWIYLDLFGWQVFKFYQHGGWFYINKYWFILYLSTGIKRLLKRIKYAISTKAKP